MSAYDQSKILTSDICAGLTVKQVAFQSLDLDAGEIKNILYEAYPTTLSSPTNLKSCVDNCHTYIGPNQNDLDLSAVFHLSQGVSKTIGIYIALSITTDKFISQGKGASHATALSVLVNYPSMFNFYF